VTSFCFLTFTFWNYYVLKLLCLETITFSDDMLSDINVVLCYILSQYRLEREMFEREGVTGLLFVLSFSFETFRFTEPPAVARLNYKRSWDFSKIFLSGGVKLTAFF
jgi:hypothetical protein